MKLIHSLYPVKLASSNAAPHIVNDLNITAVQTQNFLSATDERYLSEINQEDGLTIDFIYNRYSQLELSAPASQR